jgi:hypothetical protein
MFAGANRDGIVDSAEDHGADDGDGVDCSDATYVRRSRVAAYRILSVS